MQKRFTRQSPVKNTLPVKLLLVLTAFILMVASSCFIMFRTLNTKLLNTAEDIMVDTVVFISHLLIEPESTLNFIAGNIEGMHNRGEGYDAIKAYMTECSSQEFKDRARILSYYSVFGFFDESGGFFDGGGWSPTDGDGYDPKERFWYTAAMVAEDKVAITSPYIDADSQELVIAYARRLFDSTGSPIGIICIDVKIEYIRDLVIATRITPNSYGFMVDDNNNVIIHPNNEIQGEVLGDYNNEMRRFADAISQGADISLQRVENYFGTQSVLFGRRLDNGWYLLIMIPENEYYRELYDMMLFVSALGLVLAAAVMSVLVRLEVARKKSDKAFHEQSLQIAVMEKTYESDVKLKNALDAAEEANRAKSDFLANMSHEIRTPMNSIMGFAELALDVPDKDVTPQVRDYLRKITDNTKWLLNIINDILDISKIESGKVELENLPFDLHEVVARCESVILPEVREKSLDLRVYAEPLPGKKLIGDQVRLYQVLMNLLANAVKFTDAGTVKLSSAVISVHDSAPSDVAGATPGTASSATPVCEGGYARVYFEVRDTGIGMSPAQIKRILDPFIQADSSTTRNYGGTGLGLTITANLIHLMGGKLAVDSAPGMGSTFSFEIVFSTMDVLEDMTGSIEPHEREKPCFSGLALVCDDNPMNREVICEHLARVGLETVTAQNGKLAVEIVQDYADAGKPPFDLIFMDVFMPVMDGFEATSKIIELNTTSPIIATTANVMTSELEKYRRLGMSDCLGKPFTAHELWQILSKYLMPVDSEQGSEDVWQGTGVRDQGSGDSGQETRGRAGGGLGGGLEFEETLQKKLRVSFYRNNLNKYAEVAQAVESGDISLAHRLAHSLKGNAGQIGKTALQCIAAEIEGLLKDGSVPIPDGGMSTLKTELDLVLDELRPLAEELAANAGATSLSDEQMSALFDKLEHMLENLNPECAYLLGDIRAIPGTEELARQIEDYNFEDANQLLKVLRSKLM